jgi:hypothetical protein
MRIPRIAAGLVALAALVPAGCALMGPVRAVSPNPLVVPSADFETVWDQTVAVVDEYFDGLRENRLAGTIETDPTIGSGLIEPWRGDSVGLEERLESTLQSIRRFAKVRIEPAAGGGFAVKVEVYKELEDLTKPDRQMGGRAVFADQIPVNRTREVVGPVPLPVGWVPRNRDPKLEQAILNRLREAFFL